ncbi:hypothetical protein DH2020_044848 [Rehmannia glutinosa]|uniref:HAT C-terminal dimerisation domain-containing protein n=1 Tax=Rehmannia glutinosa TaxID=99300 RepID=A0ABR0UGH3_REHGL
MYGIEEGERLSEKLRNAIYELFNEYKRLHSSSTGAYSSSSLSINSGSSPFELNLCDNDSELMNKLKEKYRAELKRRKADSGSKNLKSELDRYLTEEDDEEEDYDSENFSVLDWWRARSPRFPILSLIAHWLRSDASQVEVEERIEDLEKFDQDIKQSVPDSTVVDV